MLIILMCALLLDVILGAIVAENYFKNKENNKICNCETDMQMASECLDMIHDEKDENSNALTQIENNDCPSDCNIDIEKLQTAPAMDLSDVKSFIDETEKLKPMTLKFKAKKTESNVTKKAKTKKTSKKAKKTK